MDIYAEIYYNILYNESIFKQLKEDENEVVW
jgi:hypothetical protein